MKTDKLYQEEPGGSFTHDKNEYDINEVFKAVDKFPIAYFKVADLSWILNEGDVNEEDDARIDAADISTPLLITMWKHKWVVLDGAHRLQRAVNDNVEQLPGKIVDAEILKNAKL